METSEEDRENIWEYNLEYPPQGGMTSVKPVVVTSQSQYHIPPQPVKICWRSFSTGADRSLPSNFVALPTLSLHNTTKQRHGPEIKHLPLASPLFHKPSTSKTLLQSRIIHHGEHFPPLLLLVYFVSSLFTCHASYFCGTARNLGLLTTLRRERWVCVYLLLAALFDSERHQTSTTAIYH